MQPLSYGAAAAAENVSPFTGWPAPNLSILEEGRRKPPAMPSAMFGKAWGELERLAADKGAPVDYVALSWLVGAASLLGSKRRVVPYPGSSWEEPSILWLGLVGDPSHNKSPALDPLQKILRKLEDGKADEHQEALNIWRGDCERAKVENAQWQEQVKTAAKDGLSTPPLPDAAQEPKQPLRRRHVVQDATPESIGAILIGNPEGTLMIRDELAGWLQGFDRYNTGGRAYWLEAYGGRPYTIDRKHCPEPMRIPYNGVNVIGGIQPGKLADSLLDLTDDGLAARLLFVWPDRPPLTRPSRNANLSGFEAAAYRIDGLDWEAGDCQHVPVHVRLSEQAADIFFNCQQSYREHEFEACGLLKSFIGKLSGLTLRLALASEFARWAYEGGAEPSEISSDTLQAVGDFIAEYALPMAQRVYGDAALPAVERNAATLAKHIKRKRLQSINARELMREDRLPGLRDAASVDPAIEVLVEAAWLKPDPQRKGGTVGRQTRDYIVNPSIWRPE